MLFRPVMLSDAADIAHIYNYYIENTTVTFDTVPIGVEVMRNKISAIISAYPYIICEHSGKVIGFCYAHKWKEKTAYAQTWETTVYVAQEYCGQGIGHQLMRKLVAECRCRTSCHALIACITSPNPASESLHRSLGFQKVSHFYAVGNKFSRWLDVTDWELSVDN